MKKQIVIPLFMLSVNLFAGNTNAQTFLPNAHYLFPAKATSADNLKLSLNRPCSDFLVYKDNAYQVKMSQNNITVTRGEIVSAPVPTCPPSSRDEVDLGRLPAGDYTLTVINAAAGPGVPSKAEFSDFPFTVTDARLLKTAPFVRLDYSGHWWDPNDSGWGLFIWHDARDNVLAALFTYAPDGKPIWYVFQPTWKTFAATNSASLLQTSRAPGASVPPANPTDYSVAGTASMDFTIIGSSIPAEAGKLTYTLTGGTPTVRNIQRFKP